MSKTIERRVSEERISRTAKNVYEKFDKATWQILPRKTEKYAMVDVMNLTISDEEEDPYLDDIDINDVINNIENLINNL